MPYIDGYLCPVPDSRKEEYSASAKERWLLYKDYGALEHWECWGDEVPDGTLTSFPMAVKKEPGETVVFGWVAWPDKATRDRLYATMAADPRWQDIEMPIDGKRMVYGGFDPIFCGRA
jgi:uncharacterized protein YbaA (DUF1428 family)